MWVEDRKGAPPEVVVRNASADPIKFVVVIVSRVGAPSKLSDAANHEIRTYRAIGPGQAIREPVTLSSIGGVVRADAEVRFVDKNLQGWERSFKQSLVKSDYSPEQFHLFDLPVREARSRRFANDSRDQLHAVDDPVESTLAGGHWLIAQSDGSTVRIPLVPVGLISEATADYTVKIKGLPRVTFRLGPDDRVVEVVLQNVPPSFITDPPRGRWPDSSLARGPEGSAVVPFFAPDEIEAASQATQYEIHVKRSPSDEPGLGHVTYDVDDNPVAVFIYDAEERLPLSFLGPDDEDGEAA